MVTLKTFTCSFDDDTKSEQSLSAAMRVAIEYGGGEGEHQHAIAMVSTAKHKWTFSTGRVLVLW